ncbi:MAG: MFS transporter [Xanthobacteraceae bacterium]|nr:MFS transporter [Xanthobacteraceae bacterium]
MIPDSLTPFATLTVRRFAMRLTLVYGAVFGLIGISLPFFPVWLKARGVDVGWIGLITAVPALTRFTVLPLITSLAEHHHALRPAITWLAFLTAIGHFVLGFFATPLPILLVFALTACAWTPIMPMVDGYVLKGVARYGLDYGPLRLWGSAAFVVGALGGGVYVDRVAPDNLIWVIVAMALFGALASLGLQPIEDHAPPDHAPRAGAGALLRQPGFLAIIFTSALVQGSHAAYYAFGSVAWQEAGLGGLTISCLWSLGVLAEIVVFAVSPRFAWSPRVLVAVAAASAALRWGLTAQQPPIAVLAVVQTMHGLSYGLTQVGIVGLMVRNVNAHVAATAQGYLAAASGIVLGGATMASGVLFRSYGEGVYYAMAVMALAGAGLILAAGPWLAPGEAEAQPQSEASGG